MFKRWLNQLDAWIFGVSHDVIDVPFSEQVESDSILVSWAGLTLACPPGFQINMTRSAEVIEFFWIGELSRLFGASPSLQLRLVSGPTGKTRLSRTLKVFRLNRVLANLIVALVVLLGFLSLILAMAKVLVPEFGLGAASIENLLLMGMASFALVIFVGLIFRIMKTLFHVPISQLSQFTGQIKLAPPKSACTGSPA